MPPPPRPRLRTFLIWTALFAFGLWLGLHYARMGFMPLDQCVVFDGGWRTLCGQVPFRDYHTPSAITPSVLTAGFFAVFGVNWFSYCLHAAVLNGLGAVLAYAGLVRLGLPRPLAFLYGGATAVVLFPPFGTPFMDSVSFFFSLVAVTLAIFAGPSGGEHDPAGREHDPAAGRERKWFWFAIPSVLMAAYLSKQVPAVLVPPVVLLLATRGGMHRLRRAVLFLALGSAAMFAALAVAMLVLEIDIDRMLLWFFVTPAEEGARRTEFIPSVGAVLRRMLQNGRRLELWTIPIVHVGAALLALGGFVGLWRGNAANGVLRLRSALLAEGLLSVCLLFTAFTSNQPEIGVGLLFLALGTLHVGLRVPAAWQPTRGMLLVCGLLLPLVALRDAFSFNARYNATRSANDFEFDAELARAVAGDLPEGLRFMRWSYTPSDLTALIDDLAPRAGAFLLFGDTTVLYGLTGKPSPMPSLWWHPRLSIPLPKDPRFELYEDLLLEAIERYDVRRLVVEGEHSWSRRKLEHFQRVMALVEARQIEERSFGPFRVLELRSE